MIEKRKQGKAEKEWESHTNIIPPMAGDGAASAGTGLRLAGNHCSDPAAVAGHHGHSGKWRKAERGRPAKPGSGHSGQYPGSAAHAGRYGSLRGRQRRRYGRGRQWSRRCRRLSRWKQFGPARQAAGAPSVKAYDSSVIRQPSCGQVDRAIFRMRPCWATA